MRKTEIKNDIWLRNGRMSILFIRKEALEQEQFEGETMSFFLNMLSFR